MRLHTQNVVGPVVNSLRQATRKQHRRIEQRFDAIAELANPMCRPAIVGRYAALYRSAHGTLAAELECVDGLEFAQRSQIWPDAKQQPIEATPPFPKPMDRCEALGLYYVVEGSTLGGRHILRQLRALGIVDATLSFLDPYGSAAGSMWRSLIAVLEREGSHGPAQLERMCCGAVRGFDFAERIFCGNSQ